MSQPVNEPDNSQGQEETGHPAWAEFLADVPEEFHHYVKPAFEKWDKGVVPASRLQELEQQYEAYKPLVQDEYDPEELLAAYRLSEAMNENPQAVVEKAIEVFGLDFVLKSAANAADGEEEEFGAGESEFDIAKHPVVLEMQKQLDAVNGTLTSKQQQEQEEKETREFEQHLSELAVKYKDAGEFDEDFVVGLVANGIEAEDAVKRYFAIINKATTPQPQTDDIPRVMGGDGTTGSGIPAQPVQMGGLDKKGVADLVAQFVDNANKQ